MLLSKEEMLSIARVAEFKTKVKMNNTIPSSFDNFKQRELCECEYPIIRQDLTEYCSICQKEVK